MKLFFLLFFFAMVAVQRQESTWKRAISSVIEFNGRGTSAAELAATEAWKEADAIVAGLSANELTPSN
uniref:Uncharacterized protein n=1 Tax=Pristionchus pacificus TaxID=54126 RepID=A0A454XNZ6_PRIPA|eukprot:PDM82786.1 hypothetical protein PRIPAC_37179 [Pristionchus pacificus]